MEGGLEGTKEGLGAWVGAAVRTDDPLRHWPYAC